MVRFVPVYSLARITATPSLAQTRERRGNPRHLLLAVRSTPRSRSAAVRLRSSRSGRPILETGTDWRPELDRLALRDVDALGPSSRPLDDVLDGMVRLLGLDVPDGARVVRVSIETDGRVEVAIADASGHRTVHHIPTEDPPNVLEA